MNQIQGYGWRPDLPDARDLILQLDPELLAKQPQHVDLVNANMPAVYDQGDLGSCTGNAIGAAVQYDHAKEGLPHNNPSRLFIYYNERVLEGSVGQDAGAQIRDGIKTLNKWGACDESTWPYDISQFAVKPTDAAYQEAAQHRAVSYRRLVNTNLNALRACLASGYPFVFGFTVYESFESDEVAKTGIMPMPQPNEQVLGGHAVLAVGYDMTTYRFKVRNSWGPDWGQGGYFFIPDLYLSNPNLADDFWVVTVVK